MSRSMEELDAAMAAALKTLGPMTEEEKAHSAAHRALPRAAQQINKMRSTILLIMRASNLSKQEQQEALWKVLSTFRKETIFDTAVKIVTVKRDYKLSAEKAVFLVGEVAREKLPEAQVELVELIASLKFKE